MENQETQLSDTQEVTNISETQGDASEVSLPAVEVVAENPPPAEVAFEEKVEVEEQKVPVYDFDVCVVEAVRESGRPAVTGLKIVSIEKSISMTEEFAKIHFNSFAVHNFGKRAYKKDSVKVGEVIPVK